MQRRRWCGAGSVGGMHVISGVRDPAVSFPLAAAVDDRDERHQANRAVAVSATGLAVSGLVELVIALVSGSAALLGDALHNLSDVSTSLLVFVGFRASRRAATPRYPYGFERAEDSLGSVSPRSSGPAPRSPAPKVSPSSSTTAPRSIWAGALPPPRRRSSAISWWPATNLRLVAGSNRPR